MKLAWKTFLIITIAVVVGFGATLGAASAALLDNYRHTEARETSAELDRIEGFVQDDLQRMEGSVSGLSDLAGALFGDPNQPITNDTTQLFLNLFFVQKIDHLFAYITDENGTTAISFSFDRATFNMTTGPAELNATLLNNGHWEGIPTGTVRSGLLADNGTGYMLASAPLALPILGNAATITIVREVTPATNFALGALAQSDVRLEPPSSVAGTQITRHDRFSLTAQRTLEGIDGAPAATLVFDAPRTTFVRGTETMQTFAWTTVAIVAFALGSGLFALKFLVTGRVRALSQQIQAIQANERLDGRVSMGGNDEVHDLARDFNQLMETLEVHEEALKIINRDLEGFASIASHDLKSPLSSFTLNLELEHLAATARNDPKSVARIDKMKRGAHTMARRIDAILAYSRSNTSTLSLGPVDLNHVVDQVLEDLHAETTTSDAIIRRLKLPHAIADPSLLQQVLQNLIANAIKYRKPGEVPHITVRAETRPGACRIHVEDQGRGFGNHEVKAMLEPFVRLPGAGVEKGHGIGLATVVRILERLGGELDVHGMPGKGARFTVTLPAPS